MPMSDDFERLQQYEIEISSLYKQEKILKSTFSMIYPKIANIRDFLTDIVNSVDNSSNRVGSLYKRETIIRSVTEDLTTLDDLMKAIRNTNKTDVKRLIQELLDIVAENCSFDLFLGESTNPHSSLWNYIHREDNELTFFLLLPHSEYLNTDRAGLIAHEAAHVHEVVKRYTESIKPEKRKIGESLGDIIGLHMAGPLFTHSLSFVVINDVGVRRAHEIFDMHPSWIARVTVLHYVSSMLWETATVKSVIEGLLGRVIDCESPRPMEDQLINECMREYDNRRAEF